MITISWIGVILAAASAFIVGSIWYMPTTFLKPWQKMTGTSDADMKKNFGMSMVWCGVAALLMSYILAHFMAYTEYTTNVTGVMAGLQTAFWLWLGVSLTTLVATSALDSRDKNLLWIQAGERLVTLLLMGLILGLFM